MNKFIDNKAFVFLCLMTVVVFWGANFVFIKLALVEFPIYTLLFYRVLFVALLMLPFVARPIWSELKLLLITSAFLVLGHFGFLFLAVLNTTNIGTVSVILQLSIPFSVLLAWIFYQDNPGRVKLFGLSLSFVGVLVLFYDPAMFQNLVALGFATLSAMFLGCYYVLVKKIKRTSPVTIVAYTSLFGVPFLYIISLFQGDDLLLFFQVESIEAWGSFAFTVLGSSILAHSLWAWLIKHQNISLISPFLLLVPVVASALSSLIFGEVISWFFVVASSFILFGVFLVFFDYRVAKKVSQPQS